MHPNVTAGNCECGGGIAILGQNGTAPGSVDSWPVRIRSLLEGSTPLPRAFPAEFRADVIALARKGEELRCARSRRTSTSPRRARCIGGSRSPTARTVSTERGPQRLQMRPRSYAELRGARKRIKLLEQEAEVTRRAVGYLSRDVNPK